MIDAMRALFGPLKRLLDWRSAFRRNLAVLMSRRRRDEVGDNGRHFRLMSQYVIGR